jgi:hypothetical protein
VTRKDTIPTNKSHKTSIPVTKKQSNDSIDDVIDNANNNIRIIKGEKEPKKNLENKDTTKGNNKKDKDSSNINDLSKKNLENKDNTKGKIKKKDKDSSDKVSSNNESNQDSDNDSGKKNVRDKGVQNTKGSAFSDGIEKDCPCISEI